MQPAEGAGNSEPLVSSDLSIYRGRAGQELCQEWYI